MHSDFTRIFNTVMFSTAAGLALVTPATVAARGGVSVSPARAVAVAPARIAPAAPIAAPAAPKPAAPAPITPAPVATPKPVAPTPAPVATPKPATTGTVANDHAVAPAQKLADGAGGNGNKGNGKPPTGGDGGKKLPPSSQPSHSDDHNFGYVYYQWLYSTPSHRRYIYQPTHASVIPRDDILNCMLNRLHHGGIDNATIESNAAHISDLKARFETARQSERSVSIGSLSKFDQAVFKAYKDCTYDW